MSLTKPSIKSDFLTIINNIDNANKVQGAQPGQIQDQYADKMADYMIATIQSLRITIPPGAIVVTDGTTVSSNAGAIVLDGVVS